MKKEAISETAKALGKLGGKKRAEKYSRAQLREWAKLGGKFGRLGGRPRKSEKPRKG